MKSKRAALSLLLGLFMLLSGCGDDVEKQGKVLAMINSYQLMLEDFKQQLVTELEFEKDYKLTKEGRKEFLEGLIRKELLIQEAKARRLDRREEFIKAMERYWGATLIRDLMEQKGEEIKKSTYVTEEEIKSRYQSMKQSNENTPPFDSIKGKIANQLREEKKRATLAQWITELREKADIHINEGLLDEKM